MVDLGFAGEELNVQGRSAAGDFTDQRSEVRCRCAEVEVAIASPSTQLRSDGSRSVI